MADVKTSSEWWHNHPMIKTMRIMDPDGWDRAGDFHYSFYREPISQEEFENRLAASTLVPRDIKQKT